MFSIRLKTYLPSSLNLKLSSANSFSLEESKICRKRVNKQKKLLLPYRGQHFAILTIFNFSSANVFSFVPFWNFAVNPFPNIPWFLHVYSIITFGHTLGKGRITHNDQFLLFPQCFLPFRKTFCHLYQVSKLSSANSFSMEESKTCSLGKGWVKI